LFNVAGVASPLALSWAIRSVAIATGAALGSSSFGTFQSRLRRNECLFFLLDLLGNRTSVADIGSSPPSLTPGRQRLLPLVSEL